MSGGTASPVYQANPYTNAPETPAGESGPKIEINFYGPVQGDEEFTQYLVDRLEDWVYGKGGKLPATEIYS